MRLTRRIWDGASWCRGWGISPPKKFRKGTKWGQKNENLVHGKFFRDSILTYPPNPGSPNQDIFLGDTPSQTLSKFEKMGKKTKISARKISSPDCSPYLESSKNAQPRHFSGGFTLSRRVLSFRGES